MAAFLKLGDIAGGGDSFLKLGDDKGDVPKSGGYRKVEWTYSSRSKLASLGMSGPGIDALIAGQPVQNEKDQAIVAGLVQKALG